MPVTDPLQGATFLPAWTEPYQVPQTIADMYQFLLSRGIPRFTTTAERDAAYPAPTTGQVAFAETTLWIYSTTWKRLWSVPIDWTNTNIVAGGGVSLSNVQYKVNSAREVSWRGEVYGASAPAENAILFSFPSSISPPASGRGGWDLSGLAGSARVFVGVFGTTGALNEVRFRAVSSGGWPSSSVLGVSLAALTWSLD